MIVGPESFKLSELRAKTDRDLATLVSNQIETALTFQRQGMEHKAQRATREARTLLRFVDASQRRRLECKLRTVAETPNIQTACAR
jgi:hypothetical protein